MGKLDLGVLLRTLGGVVCLNNHLDNIGAYDIKRNFSVPFGVSRLYYFKYDKWVERKKIDTTFLIQVFLFLLGWYTVQQLCFFNVERTHPSLGQGLVFLVMTHASE